jgi:hypothetical protein
MDIEKEKADEELKLQLQTLKSKALNDELTIRKLKDENSVLKDENSVLKQ